MEKLEYLVRTLSRTRRKDYENYVVNAVWNRLDDADVHPVTQQLVAVGSNERRFIDLYFPQVNIGVECNEAFHQEIRQHDRERTIQIFDVLRQVQPDSGYRQLDIDIVDPATGNYRTLEEVDEAIQRAVETIQEAIQQRRDAGEFKPWRPQQHDPVELVQSWEELRVSDDMSFRTMAQACNALFGDTYKRLQRSSFVTQRLGELYGSEFSVWFPKAELGGKAVSRGWHNILSEDGSTLDEYNDQDDVVDNASGAKFVVFIQTYDPITRARPYRFAGVFQRRGTSEVDGNPTKHYVRITTSFPVSRRPQ